jgi:hypothetical protein
MRAKVNDKMKHKARGVSLPPDMWKIAFQRAHKLDISFSKYVQRLIREDLTNQTLKGA